MSPRPTFATVAEYLSALEPEQAKAMRRVLATVRKAVPAAAPVISYGIPAFKQDRVFIYCAAFKKHVGIYPPVRGNTALRAALEPYANAKGNLRFALDEALPLGLIARVAKALAKQAAQVAGSRRKQGARKDGAGNSDQGRPGHSRRNSGRLA
jgi:uncharacterized protein YdhG (YjbR/CyaY superfamily)